MNGNGRLVRRLGVAGAAALGAALLVSRARQSVGAVDVKALTIKLLEHLLPTSRAFDVRLWDGTVLAATESSARATLVLARPHALGSMLRLPLDMGLGEAYLRGDMDIEGDVSAVLRMMDGMNVELGPKDLADLARAALKLRAAASVAGPDLGQGHGGKVHSKERDKAAVSYHYDVSNDFYKLWLDDRMVYSCGYFPTGTETLNEAQEAKLHHICRKLRLQPGERLLDIGCGWGGLAIFAAQQYGARVVGVTLSERQLDEARARVKAAGLDGQVTLELLDYRDVEGEFDKITSVGMAEHVGRANIPLYFKKAYDLLRPGGLMMHHAISDGIPQAKVNPLIVSGEFARRYVFPDGELQAIWETLRDAEAQKFEVRDVENLREHYARTISCWRDSLDARTGEAAEMVGAQKMRLWRVYLAGCVIAFSDAHLAIFQTLLAKPRAGGKVDLPLSRADLYT